MLTSIGQVNKEFFKKFFKLKIDGEVIPIRYARKSSYDYTEEWQNQQYPCIAIQDYIPTLDDRWYVDLREYFSGLSMDKSKGKLYSRPVWLDFRYDVSIATKSYTDYQKLQDYFLTNFVSNTRFVFNKKIIDGNTIGDVIPYSVRQTDIPRMDVVFETNYEFTLNVWVYPKEPKEVETINKILLTLQERGL